MYAPVLLVILRMDFWGGKSNKSNSMRCTRDSKRLAKSIVQSRAIENTICVCVAALSNL